MHCKVTVDKLRHRNIINLKNCNMAIALWICARAKFNQVVMEIFWGILVLKQAILYREKRAIKNYIQRYR